MARGAVGRAMLRAEQDPEFEQAVSQVPEFVQAREQARRTGKTVTGTYQGQTFKVAPDGLFYTPEGFWKSIRNGLIAAGVVAGGYYGAQALGLGGGSAGIGETGATTGLSGPISGMATVDPLGTVGPFAASGSTATTTATTAGAVGKAAGTAGATKSLADKISDWTKLGLTGAGAVAAFSDARNANRRSDEELALERQRLELQKQAEQRAAQRQFEEEMLARAAQEAQERRQANVDAYRASWYQNRRPGPFNTAGYPAVSSNYMSALSALEQEAMKRLTSPRRYSTDQFPDLANPTRSTNV